jgi:MFS family permease
LRQLDKDLESSSDASKDIEKEENQENIEEVATHSPSTSATPSHTSTNDDSNEPIRHIIRFEDGDPENPNNWSMPKKSFALFVAIMSVMNSTMSSSLASGATAPISLHFSVTSEYLLILPTSMFLVGYVFGPMAWGPLSESYGRKGTMVYSFAILTVFSIASAVAPNFAALVVFRLFVGIGGSAAISVVGGICADVWHDPVARGRSMAIFMAATTFGPILGPPVSGFISVVSWNWAFWIGAIFAGVTWPLFVFFPETYGPAILKRKAQQLRKETGDESIVAPLELEKTDLNHIVPVPELRV